MVAGKMGSGTVQTEHGTAAQWDWVTTGTAAQWDLRITVWAADLRVTMEAAVYWGPGELYLVPLDSQDSTQGSSDWDGMRLCFNRFLVYLKMRPTYQHLWLYTINYKSVKFRSLREKVNDAISTLFWKKKIRGTEMIFTLNLSVLHSSQ